MRGWLLWIQLLGACGWTVGATIVGQYVINDLLTMGRVFDGIGAISGGGATSKLLPNYPLKQRHEILDYLFLPNFGASLQILKVEIGGDSQSTDGTESSHMHSRGDLNLQRGYEWWLMKEAKKRNPLIKLYGLPWVWPGWLGGDTRDPFTNVNDTITYIMNWIQGARREHNLTIDYIGVWNERSYNVDYIKGLRRTLDRSGFAHVGVVAADGGWSIMKDILADPELQAAIEIVGVHYPGTTSPKEALTSGKRLWASEDYSTYNDDAGAACWARILAENYVHGYFTGVIAWNLLASYYSALPYTGSSLMTADQPWSGHYTVSNPIWITAHFTQFISPGWLYYPHGMGSSALLANGTFVTLASPDFKDLTIVIVTVDPEFAPCFYPMPKYTIQPQTAVFKLQGHFANIDHLNVWHSRISASGNGSVFFQNEAPIKITDGTFQLDLRVNEIYTLTTRGCGTKGSHGTPPRPAPFPPNYLDDFESYRENEEPFNLVAQAGVFEVLSLSTGNAICQMVPQPPVDTCRPQTMPRPVAVIGNNSWTDIGIEVDFRLPANTSQAVFVGGRVNHGGCATANANGTFLWAFPAKKSLILTADANRTAVYATYPVKLYFSKWHRLRLQIQGENAEGFLDGRHIFSQPITMEPSSHGFASIGVDSFSTGVCFDNLNLINGTVY